MPLLGSESDTSHLYSTKPGARRLLRDAGVSIPPYEADIFSQDQLYERLALLIANNPLISRWMFKLPEQVKGRGFGKICLLFKITILLAGYYYAAYCDVTQYLPCYNWVLKEAKRYGSKWSKYWAQEKALKTITSYLPDILAGHTQIVDTLLYLQWEDFLQHFLQVGGLIEGVPPSDSITPISVDILINPTGQVKVLCSLDQVATIIDRYVTSHVISYFVS